MNEQWMVNACKVFGSYLQKRRDAAILNVKMTIFIPVLGISAFPETFDFIWLRQCQEYYDGVFAYSTKRQNICIHPPKPEI